MKVTNADIKRLMKECGILASVQDDLPFNEQRVDSLDKTNLFLHIEESYGCKIGADDYARLNTINDIVGFLNENLS